MSPTILEAVVLIILLIVAWQLGILLAPIILRELRSMRQSLDDVSEDVPDETPETPDKKEDEVHSRKD